jgi:pSer/pThr/pTyr-binding forkhead associated (FHA) protein
MPLDKNTSRNIHMLTVTEKKNEFKLGRGHESEVRINDISVSRCHAIIKCKKDGFYIEDNCSKFGTIVLLKNNLQLEEDHTMAVQVGRTVLSFTIKSIDLDKRMREKLKREIRPLLNRTKEAEKEQKEEETKQNDLLALEGGARGLSQGPGG